MKNQKPKGLKKQAKQVTSKEQKAQEAEIARQRGLVKDMIYPYLLKHCGTVVEAKRLCYEVQAALTQEFQKIIAESQRKLSEALTNTIKITDITKRGDAFKVNKGLYDLFKSEKVSTTNALLGGMQTALDSFVQEELANRPLNTIKTDFL